MHKSWDAFDVIGFKIGKVDDDCWRVHDPKVLPFMLGVKEVGTQYLCFAILLINAQAFY